MRRLCSANIYHVTKWVKTTHYQQILVNLIKCSNNTSIFIMLPFGSFLIQSQIKTFYFFTFFFLSGSYRVSLCIFNPRIKTSNIRLFSFFTLPNLPFAFKHLKLHISNNSQNQDSFFPKTLESYIQHQNTSIF